jgi:hypothetical protein
MFKRVYLVNLIPNKRTEKPEERPSEKKGSSELDKSERALF